MASQQAVIIDSHRENAEICHGDGPCKKMLTELLKEVGLPVGLLPLEDLQEVGYNRASGFLWMVRKKKRERTFKAIQKTVSYATEVTALVEARKIKKVTGVKVRELLLWRSVVEVYIDDPSSGKITLKTGTDLSECSFPASAFEPGGLKDRKKGRAYKRGNALSLAVMRALSFVSFTSS